MRDECQHGSLRRKCEICERDATIAELIHVLEVLRDADEDRKRDREWPTFPPTIRAMIDKSLQENGR